MGQTLTHGVYLPSEGERNCYSGLASNWRLLNGAIGTVAAHTTAIAEKAPLVHTHTVSQITDFPAYGTTAGTICEGNDSRLSDARTPVAHTHTKADITDLLNSNFIPSANNFYDLGSNSHQWNNLYAKNYYYNGVAWGLDKANEWKNTNFFTLSLYQKGFSSRAAIPASNEFGTLNVSDNDNAPLITINYANRTSGERDISFRVYDTSGNVNGAMIRKDASNNYSFCSIDPNNTISLGTSTNKWKTFNGINPGALSLPVFGTTYRQALDTTGWVLDGSAANTFIPSISGWLNIRISDLSGSYIVIQSGAITVSNHGAGAIPSSVLTRALAILFPVEAGESVSIRLNTTSVAGFIYPCQGSV